MRLFRLLPVLALLLACPLSPADARSGGPGPQKPIWPPKGGIGATGPWIIGPVGPNPLPPRGMPQPKAKAGSK